MTPEQRLEQWKAQWPQAMEIWSPYVRLRDPVFCMTQQEALNENLTDSFAMIRLADHSVVVSPTMAEEAHVGDLALEILAHEVGHHIYTPGDLNDYGRLAVRIFRGLGRQNQYTAQVANLYEDLLINDRLFRDKGLRMDQVYLRLREPTKSPLWNFYMRTYEVLWSLDRGSLCTALEVKAAMEADAQIAARLIRRYADQWMDGGGRFAALALPYVMEEAAHGSVRKSKWGDTLNAGSGTGELPQGLAEVEADEVNPLHPSLDPELTGLDEESGPGKPPQSGPGGPGGGGAGSGAGQFREPFQLGQILRALGMDISDEDLAKKYYRERALPYLIPFPKREMPQSSDPLPEGLDTWDIGSPLDQINWVATASRSPVIIPGYTTVEQVWGIQPGQDPQKEPIDLDLYVDCSGSMPDPSYNTSYLTLAGAIIALSALRAGSRVQATLWSGAGEFMITPGFVREEEPILKVLTGYFGGGTAFPIHILRETYEKRKPTDRKVHILVISDEGVDTMFSKDEKGNSGLDIAPMALKNAGGGGTFVLNLYQDWQKYEALRTAAQMGWDIQKVATWEDLVGFAKAFAKKQYGQEKT